MSIADNLEETMRKIDLNEESNEMTEENFDSEANENKDKNLAKEIKTVDLDINKIDEDHELLERIRSISAKQLNVDIETIKLQSNFVTDLGADSLDLVELVMSFEEEFDCEIPDEVAEKIQTLDAALKYIKLQMSLKK